MSITFPKPAPMQTGNDLFDKDPYVGAYSKEATKNDFVKDLALNIETLRTTVFKGKFSPDLAFINYFRADICNLSTVYSNNKVSPEDSKWNKLKELSERLEKISDFIHKNKDSPLPETIQSHEEKYPPHLQITTNDSTPENSIPLPAHNEDFLNLSPISSPKNKDLDIKDLQECLNKLHLFDTKEDQENDNMQTILNVPEDDDSSLGSEDDSFLSQANDSSQDLPFFAAVPSHHVTDVGIPENIEDKSKEYQRYVKKLHSVSKNGRAKLRRIFFKGIYSKPSQSSEFLERKTIPEILWLVRFSTLFAKKTDCVFTPYREASLAVTETLAQKTTLLSSEKKWALHQLTMCCFTNPKPKKGFGTKVYNIITP